MFKCKFLTVKFKYKLEIWIFYRCEDNEIEKQIYSPGKKLIKIKPWKPWEIK